MRTSQKWGRLSDEPEFPFISRLARQVKNILPPPGRFDRPTLDGTAASRHIETFLTAQAGTPAGPTSLREDFYEQLHQETLQVRPIFDFELLLSLLSEKRLGGKVLEELADAWERWLPKLHAIKLETGKGRYLALWLDQDVERKWTKNGQNPPNTDSA